MGGATQSRAPRFKTVNRETLELFFMQIKLFKHFAKNMGGTILDTLNYHIYFRTLGRFWNY